MGVLDTDYDNPDKLLAVVGSFWRNVYEGSYPVGSILHARAQLDFVGHLQLLDLVASISRYTVPVFHTRNWFLLRLLETGKDAEIPRFDGEYAYDDAAKLRYGEPVTRDLHTWELPKGFTGAKVMLNRITDASLTLVEGVDYTVGDGFVRFVKNPFDDDRISKRELLEDDQIVDRECGLWCYRGEWDWDTVYRQFGYALGIQLKSSEGYKRLVNAVFDSLVQGTTVRSVEDAFSAICGIPLAEGIETVEEIWKDDNHLWVVTDQHAYPFAPTATPTVEVDQFLTPGSPLVRGLRFLDINRGHTAVLAGLRALVLGRGVLASGFYQELMFEDKDVPLVATVDAAGKTRVSWELTGFPGDVEEFFDRVHARGLGLGKTLAQLLDTRPADAKAENPEPPPAALPATINPLKFLCDNVLRNNAFVVHCRPAEFGPNALGLGVAAQVLRRVIPAPTLCVVLAELSVADAPVTMAAPGTDDKPGGVETVTAFTGVAQAETLDPALASETVRARTITGRCE